jgi:TatD DNase family protein
MRWTDTHAHLAEDEFKDDIQEVIHRAGENHVERIVLIGCEVRGALKALKLAHTNNLFDVAIGFHPGDVLHHHNYDQMFELMKDDKVKIIGEIGLDFYWDKNPEHHKLQEELFIKQIEWANQLNKPICVHMRDASKRTLELLKEYPANRKGIMHCFSGSLEIAREFIKLGYYISLAGPVTFKNAHVPKEVAKYIDINYLLIETDSPYLTPHPYRGKRNESYYVVEVAKEIAELRNITLEDLSGILENNYQRLIEA